jgi:hypothetical protein
MKWLLPLLIAGSMSCTGYAQDQNALQEFREKVMAVRVLKQNSWNAPQIDTTKESVGSMLTYRGTRPGVHRLPLDNMPCLVPDPNASAAITNLWKGNIRVPFRSQTQPIPNPARPPLNVSPSRPLLVTPLTK